MSSRRGVTLLEIAIVVAIIGILAAIAGTMVTQTMPSWRTRRAAREFSASLNQCRQLAVAQGVEYRIRMANADTDLDGSGPGVGKYFIERGNSGVNSTSWDILPWDADGSDANVGEGTIEISEGTPNGLRGVSIKEWAPIAGVDGDDLVFSPRGWLVNPVSDFNAEGYVEITFANKPARLRGETDEWTVMVSRGGLVRLESNRQAPVGGPSGTPSASGWTSSAATGHNP
ncbi:MAG: prepilin-type N-terminal cleavage/methylation domain-containing protein [Pseudomonadota bacterium]|nr:prepilin-type N-terminal cleavage/methylation domain-containing protein [Pseudomonadota bacterium]